jgi:hypothetical protein
MPQAAGKFNLRLEMSQMSREGREEKRRSKKFPSQSSRLSRDILLFKNFSLPRKIFRKIIRRKHESKNHHHPQESRP